MEAEAFSRPTRSEMESMLRRDWGCWGIWALGSKLGNTARIRPLMLRSRTPSAVGDTTFPTINEHKAVPAPSRRPLPNLISAFIPSASAMLSGSFRSSTTTPANGGDAVSKPPAMKRPRGGHGIKKPAETPAGKDLRPNGRDLKSIEPNGEEPPPRRSTRLKSTSAKPGSKVGHVPQR